MIINTIEPKGHATSSISTLNITLLFYRFTHLLETQLSTYLRDAIAVDLVHLVEAVRCRRHHLIFVVVVEEIELINIIELFHYYRYNGGF